MPLSEPVTFALSGSLATSVAALVTDRAVSLETVVGSKSTNLTTAAGNGFVFFLAYYVVATTGLRLVGRHSLDGVTPASGRNAETLAFFVGATAAVCTRLLGPRDDVELQHENTVGTESRPQNGGTGAGIPPKHDARQHRWSLAALEDDLVLALDPGLTFCIHELLARLVAQRQGRRQPSRQQYTNGPRAALITFLLAAASKAISTAITYPLYAASFIAEAKSRRLPPTEPDDDGNDKILALLWKTFRHPGGPRVLYDGWLRNVASAALSHGITMAIQRALYGLVLQLVCSATNALRKRRASISHTTKVVFSDATEARRSSLQVPAATVNHFRNEPEKATKAVETWLESTTVSSDVAQSNASHDTARLLPHPNSSASPKAIASSHESWVANQHPRQGGSHRTSPKDSALVRYDATQRTETTIPRTRGAPFQSASGAESRTPPTESGTGIEHDDDGAGTVIFNMISKIPRVVKK
ncbi:uncharacterized protein SPSK_05275 [Sporothrix schenckii 1099-18]|uniref:Uncharacterized protein n=1 Tax=Sporothrix schenckii 1099-18 TaxID=1397361 RepID=A0A0F2LXD5_SPOSC|nr:uncharacterized protein SPSK_05275 [Sporothrix schenckii 1099-18]KJR80556.1 hypothetical protein SPSK_05275 [Sporothrix schenckii 1099-18]